MGTRMKDRSVIVTGGSKGLGRGIAQVFASEGAKVWLSQGVKKPERTPFRRLLDAGGHGVFLQCRRQ